MFEVVEGTELLESVSTGVDIEPGMAPEVLILLLLVEGAELSAVTLIFDASGKLMELATKLWGIGLMDDASEDMIEVLDGSGGLACSEANGSGASVGPVGIVEVMGVADKVCSDTEEISNTELDASLLVKVLEKLDDDAIRDERKIVLSSAALESTEDSPVDRVGPRLNKNRLEDTS